jgi:hypothetical protein
LISAAVRSLRLSFTIPDMVALVRSGLATATAERVVAGKRTIEVARACGSPTRETEPLEVCCE